jgi:hypothetical protein
MEAGASLKQDPGSLDFNVPTGPATVAPLSGCGGPGYAATFRVGAQDFQLTIDTGSATMAIAGSDCLDCGVSPLYGPGPGAMRDGLHVNAKYLLGGWEGDVYTDSVALGAAGPMGLKLVAINAMTGFFSQRDCSRGAPPFAPQGIVGFGPAGLAVDGTDAFVPKLFEKVGGRRVFAAEFCPSGGQLMIGGVDPVAARLTGPAVYTPMTDSSYYGVTLESVQIGGNRLAFGPSDFGATVVDTGTSVIALPDAVFQPLASAIAGDAAFTAAFGGSTNWLGTTTCMSSSMARDELDARLPALTLTFPGVAGGNVTLVLPATESYLAPTGAHDGTYCSGILSNPMAMGTILGTSAMPGNLVVFDLDQRVFGYAPQAFCRDNDAG